MKPVSSRTEGRRFTAGTWVALLLASWLGWPLLVAAVNLLLFPGVQCAADADCAPTTSWRAAAGWIALALLPGVTVTTLWRRHRRARAGIAPPAV